ncbi:hypothetical protein H5410_025713 [Solanum commersonii]|uniref:Uncharacterized protein n=1 Tax=Solanum commersonii TaxID=4109 RepID=A0A9J5YWM8_SOLCO|nr:hypothetical protein H5410_025713 [Solanum commersonii]
MIKTSYDNVKDTLFIQDLEEINIRINTRSVGKKEKLVKLKIIRVYIQLIDINLDKLNVCIFSSKVIKSWFHDLYHFILALYFSPCNKVVYYYYFIIIFKKSNVAAIGGNNVLFKY